MVSGLSITDLDKRFGRNLALEGISLDIPAGSQAVIVGPSGSGKSTLLRLIAGFDVPDRGRIESDGLVFADGATAVPAHRRNVGFVTQDGGLFPHFSVRRNIGFGLARKAPDRRHRIAELMDLVELDPELADRRPHELSGGQQQRVALARALARRPRVMLLDEPFSALDTRLREAMRVATGRLLCEAGITTILVTHDQEEALSFADLLVVLRNGRVRQVGTPHEVYFHPRDADTAQFLGEAVILPAVFDQGVARCCLGAIPATGSARCGPVTIALRPEQLRIGPAPTMVDWGHAEGAVARVAGVHFSGASSTVTVALPADDGADRLLTVRNPGFEPPSIGAAVSVTVMGRAHVLEVVPEAVVSGKQ
jgi:iron(III) transport system ATP-binding protein